MATSEQKEFRKVERRSPFLKFAAIGDKIEGTYLGRKPVMIRGVAEFRPAITLSSGETKFFPSNWDLMERLLLVRVGAGVRVTFINKTTLPNGRTLHIFDVESDQPQLEAPAEPDGPAAKTEPQEELPF